MRDSSVITGGDTLVCCCLVPADGLDALPVDGPPPEFAEDEPPPESGSAVLDELPVVVAPRC